MRAYAASTGGGGLSPSSIIGPQATCGGLLEYFSTLYTYLYSRSVMKNFLKEFETFAVRGNALELAVGVVIGAAFNQITTSLATNILTPPVGLLLGGLDFSKLEFQLGGEATIGYGLFLQAVLNFVLITLALFLFVKSINRLTKRRAQVEKTPAESSELKILREIRDELRKRS